MADGRQCHSTHPELQAFCQDVLQDMHMSFQNLHEELLMALHGSDETLRQPPPLSTCEQTSIADRDVHCLELLKVPFPPLPPLSHSNPANGRLASQGIAPASELELESLKCPISISTEAPLHTDERGGGPQGDYKKAKNEEDLPLIVRLRLMRSIMRQRSPENEEDLPLIVRLRLMRSIMRQRSPEKQPEHLELAQQKDGQAQGGPSHAQEVQDMSPLFGSGTQQQHNLSSSIKIKDSDDDGVEIVKEVLTVHEDVRQARPSGMGLCTSASANAQVEDRKRGKRGGKIKGSASDAIYPQVKQGTGKRSFTNVATNVSMPAPLPPLAKSLMKKRWTPVPASSPPLSFPGPPDAAASASSVVTSAPTASPSPAAAAAAADPGIMASQPCLPVCNSDEPQTAHQSGPNPVLSYKQSPDFNTSANGVCGLIVGQGYLTEADAHRVEPPTLSRPISGGWGLQSCLNHEDDMHHSNEEGSAHLLSRDQPESELNVPAQEHVHHGLTSQISNPLQALGSSWTTDISNVVSFCKPPPKFRPCIYQPHTSGVKETFPKSHNSVQPSEDAVTQEPRVSMPASVSHGIQDEGGRSLVKEIFCKAIQNASEAQSLNRGCAEDDHPPCNDNSCEAEKDAKIHKQERGCVVAIEATESRSVRACVHGEEDHTSVRAGAQGGEDHASVRACAQGEEDHASVRACAQGEDHTSVRACAQGGEDHASVRACAQGEEDHTSVRACAQGEEDHTSVRVCAQGEDHTSVRACAQGEEDHTSVRVCAQGEEDHTSVRVCVQGEDHTSVRVCAQGEEDHTSVRDCVQDAEEESQVACNGLFGQELLYMHTCVEHTALPDYPDMLEHPSIVHDPQLFGDRLDQPCSSHLNSVIEQLEENNSSVYMQPSTDMGHHVPSTDMGHHVPSTVTNSRPFKEGEELYDSARDQKCGQPSEVEEEEWRKRQEVIAAQRIEAARQREERKRRLQSEVHQASRIKARLESLRSVEENALAEAAAKERHRVAIRQELEKKHGVAMKTLNLPRLLAELQVPVKGLASLTRVQALEATKKALRLAKIKYHPDKVSNGDFKVKVRAEEISKILNAWDLSTL
ncbi:hypothetical protein CEUSTIGMA_g9106.t1 [Chlamydomonas eustigma]|uniref:J domain-containing protein n=1 Tax=Chlamydomonas eustigma TaxID=1157962 RepID=A0A250XF15_9CHLO|nr:hypothetical protein CEUSTIGMA_g9106.t1 [Chlamydomonas eustigma]|eukprot:GAX81678.1 hypothetical protein CEUSTIGMA_g9106.t1 [Chlamydomonas eustigma]